MNTDFVIEPKYNNDVGFIHLEESRKLVRHYEMNEYNQFSGERHITLDVYEDGLIQCYEKSMSCSSHTISLIFTIELTNGEKIDTTLLELIDNIYSPFCEKKIIENMNDGYGYSDIAPLIDGLPYRPYISGFHRPTLIRHGGNDSGGRIILFKETFQTLQTIKKLYDKIVIF